MILLLFVLLSFSYGMAKGVPKSPIDAKEVLQIFKLADVELTQPEFFDKKRMTQLAESTHYYYNDKSGRLDSTRSVCQLIHPKPYHRRVLYKYKPLDTGYQEESIWEDLTNKEFFLTEKNIFDSLGKPLMEISKVPEYNADTSFYVYNKKGHLMESYGRNGEGWLGSHRKYTYDGKGRLTGFIPLKGWTHKSTHYVFNAFDSVTAEIRQDKSGIYKLIEVRFFDKQQRLTKEIRFDNTAENVTVDGVRYYKYQTNPTRKTQYFIPYSSLEKKPQLRMVLQEIFDEKGRIKVKVQRGLPIK